MSKKTNEWAEKYHLGKRIQFDWIDPTQERREIGDVLKINTKNNMMVVADPSSGYGHWVGFDEIKNIIVLGDSDDFRNKT